MKVRRPSPSRLLARGLSGCMRALGCLVVGGVLLPGSMRGDEVAPPAEALLVITLEDGSILHGQPVHPQVELVPLNLRTRMTLKWPVIQEMKAEPEGDILTVRLGNEDILKARWVEAVLPVNTSFGLIRLPTRQIAGLRTRVAGPQGKNIALGKPVKGQDGASHGKGLARHVTDGDYETHAKPPSTRFDYTIDLREPGNDGFSISGIKIHWRQYGDRFKGVPAADGNGWSRGGWPGEYVTSYEIHCRRTDAADWIVVHQCGSRPADEEHPKVVVEKLPTEMAGCSSEVTTTIGGMNLRDIAEVRITAAGGHWIGLYELEVFGAP